MKTLLILPFLLVAAQYVWAESERPNFVFLLGDDINRDSIGCYGGGVTCNTPNIDQMAADGIRFTKAYTTVAMCAPFRQELYSGRTPWRTRALLNHSSSVRETRSLPHYLQPLGYEVALLGKSHIGPDKAYPFRRLGSAKGKEDPNAFFFEKTTEFIEECQAEKRPFCIFVAVNDAHAPFTNGDPSVYKPEELNIPPYWIDTPELREALPPYLAEITHFDALAGMIRSFLDEKELSQNTIFFVCTEQGSQFPFAKWTCFDNGLHTGLVAYSPGRIPAGSLSEELLWMCDIAPTILEAAGGEVNQEDFDGKSQLGALTGNAEKLHDFVVGAFSNKGIIDNVERIYPIRSIRDGRYSLIYSPNQDGLTSNVTLTHALQLIQEEANPKQKSAAGSWVTARGNDDPLVRQLHYRPEFALYDLEKDPYELTNLAEDPEHKEVFERLQTTLFQFLEEHGDLDPVATEEAAVKKNHTTE